MNKSESIVQLARALTLAQKDMGKASMDSANPFFKSKYADLTSVWEACRKPLTDNGLSIVQTLGIAGVSESQVLETILLHNSGEWISGILKLNPVKDDPQGYGSAITYARRYSLAAIIGVCPEDDDGEGAMKRQKAESKAEPKAKPVAKQFASSPSGVIKSSKEVDADGTGDITDPQIRKINALLTFLKITDDKARHETVSVILGLPDTTTSMKLLTKAQASTVIETLEVKGE